MSELPNREQIAEVAGRVLEEAAFIFTEPMEEEEEWDDDVLMSVISFSGPKKGRIALASSFQFGTELAANLLGVEPDDEQAAEKAGGALSEILNMLAGSLVAEVFGTGVVVNLGIPETKRIDKEDFSSQSGDYSEWLHFQTDDDSRIDLGIQFDE